MTGMQHMRRFVVMGCLDSFGTFFTAMGAVYVPGQLQQLVNQSLIPATMCASWLFLGTAYSRGQLASAVLIVSGAALSILPHLLHHSSRSGADRPDDEVRAYAVAIYWLSNVPMACSAVYKEASFSREPMDVTYLTQWVSIWQMLFGFALAPLQAIPGVGSDRGQSWLSICSSFMSGLRCFLQQPGSEPELGADLSEPAGSPGTHGSCKLRHTVLLVAYVGMNFVFNTTGLYLTKRGGAVLNSISYSLLLPLTTIVFSMPILGEYRESVFPSTYAGLLVVMLGFGGWRYYHMQEGEHDRRAPTSTRTEAPTATGASPDGDTAFSLQETRSTPSLPPWSPPASFQERVIGVGRIAKKWVAGQTPQLARILLK